MEGMKQEEKKGRTEGREKKEKRKNSSNCNQILQNGSIFSLILQLICEQVDIDVIPLMPLDIFIIFYF